MALLLALTLSACGYSTRELFPTEYRSVAVPIFENRTFYRGIEYDMTEAFVKELEQRTPYITLDAGTADTLVRGSVVGLETRQLSRTREAGLPQEVEVTLLVDFTWTDQRTGTVLVDRRRLASVGRYVPTQPVGERLDLGQRAAVQRTAQDLVSAMRGDW
jgi:hypothetical protein